MPRISTVVLALAVVIGSVQVFGQQKKVPFSFVITVTESEITSGSNVVVEATITNTSDKAIGLDMMDISPYVAIVRGANGNLAPETELGQKLKEKQRERINPNYINVSRIGFTLQPGESVHEKCIVSERYDMRAPGQYSIQLERLWSRLAVSSNTIVVQVIP